MVLSAVGSDKDNVVSKSLSDSPSKIIGEIPLSTPVDVACTPVKLDPSPLNEFAVTVPVVKRFSSPKEIEPSESVILPVERVIVPSIDASSATVKSSVEVICSAEIIPEAVTSPVTVCAPDDSVPVVLKFSSPKEIEPSESVILPVERVIVPSIDASSATVKSSVEVICSAEIIPEAVTSPVTVCAPDDSVPVVLKFSSLNEIVPLESVIIPLLKTRSPILDPELATMIPVVFNLLFVNDISPLPSEISPSERVKLPIDEPEESSVTPADKLPVVTKLSFPKSISSDDDTIDPFVNVISPNCVLKKKSLHLRLQSHL